MGCRRQAITYSSDDKDLGCIVATPKINEFALSEISELMYGRRKALYYHDHDDDGDGDDGMVVMMMTLWTISFPVRILEFWHVFFGIKIRVFWLQFDWSLFQRVHSTIIQHRLGYWFGAEQATYHYLIQCWPLSFISYGITKPQWVNIFDRVYHIIYIGYRFLVRPPCWSLLTYGWKKWIDNITDTSLWSWRRRSL